MTFLGLISPTTTLSECRYETFSKKEMHTSTRSALVQPGKALRNRRGFMITRNSWPLALVIMYPTNSPDSFDTTASGKQIPSEARLFAANRSTFALR